MKNNGKYKINSKNFNKVCRLCLSEYVLSKSKDLFQKKIQGMLEFCSSIKLVKQVDGLPSRVCLSCCQNLVKFYTFKNKIERIDRILNAYKKSRDSKPDILDIALNEADIQVNEAISNCEDESLIVNPSRGDNTRNDTKESVVTGNSLWPRKTKENAIKIIHNIINDNEINEEFIDKVENAQDVFVEFPLSNIELEPNNSVTQNEPPPLIPIKSKPDDSIPLNTEKTFECSKCNENFTSDTLLKKHTTKCIASLTCNICKKKFKERKKLIGHLKGHMVAKNYECKICGKRYPNPSTFEIHMRTHTGERPFKCPVCSKGFARWAGVVSHMQTHYDHRPFKCETCNKSFKILSNLERHKVLHSETMPFCCNYCGKTFSQSDNLQLHIRSYHTNERPYLCSQCGKGFVSSTRLNRHTWIHTGYKPFRCNVCPKAYFNSSDLKNHERGAHGNGNGEKPFACTLCEMRFYHPCRLSKHLKTHQRPFACSHCNKSFSSNSLLEKHTDTAHCVKESGDVILY